MYFRKDFTFRPSWKQNRTKWRDTVKSGIRKQDIGHIGKTNHENKILECCLIVDGHGCEEINLQKHQDGKWNRKGAKKRRAEDDRKRRRMEEGREREKGKKKSLDARAPDTGKSCRKNDITKKERITLKLSKNFSYSEWNATGQC